jgi:hypothetical protein
LLIGNGRGNLRTLCIQQQQADAGNSFFTRFEPPVVVAVVIDASGQCSRFELAEVVVRAHCPEARTISTTESTSAWPTCTPSIRPTCGRPLIKPSGVVSTIE